MGWAHAVLCGRYLSKHTILTVSFPHWRKQVFGEELRPHYPKPKKQTTLDAYYQHNNQTITQKKNVLFGDELGLFEAICLMRLPWQLSATSREIVAVFPNPTFPVMTAPLFSAGSVFFNPSSIASNSHSLPTNTESVVILGTSNNSGFSKMSWGL